MNKVIILLGPTGVGKTEASLLLARHLATEIISADSMQIYKGMDIGTAKPSPKQREEIKHHMIDVVSPSESYNVGKYVEDVIPIIENLHSKGKIPLIAGGTGLYVKAMTRGIFSGPSADWQLRDDLLEMENEQEGSLYNYLKKLDTQAAQKIMPEDKRRIIRAIEVCVKTKQGISQIQKELTKPLPYEFLKIGLTRDRKELYGNIEIRVDKMISNGLIDEVKKILSMNPDKTPMQAIGYKEAAEYLNGKIPLDEAVRLIKRNTKRYAKRQFTWFKKEEGINWIDVAGIFESNEVLGKIKDVLYTLI